MAETEQREDVAVKIGAAVVAARTAIPEPEHQAAPAIAPPVLEPAPVQSASSESRRIKERMMRASRARRKERPDLVTESTDPALPDWYEPDVDEADGATSSNVDSAARR